MTGLKKGGGDNMKLMLGCVFAFIFLWFVSYVIYIITSYGRLISIIENLEEIKTNVEEIKTNVEEIKNR
jgi:hypothetical protein